MFILLINRVDKIFDTNYSTHVLHYNETTVLSTAGNLSVEGPIGSSDNAENGIPSTKYSAVSGTIDSSGRYSFVQKFNKVTKETDYNVYIKSTGVAYANLSGDILNWDKADYSRWPGYYVKTMTQYMNPVLTLKATVGSNYALTHVNGVAISPAPSAGDDYSATYTGLPNTNRKTLLKTTSSTVTTDFDVTYLLNGTDTKSFTYNRVPVFSNTIAYDGKGLPTSASTKLSSDWTNTIPSENGGTEISIHNIVSELSADGGTSNGLCTISFSVRIQRWGTESLTLDLDLDKLVATT